jgi:hypothetical protein
MGQTPSWSTGSGNISWLAPNQEKPQLSQAFSLENTGKYSPEIAVREEAVMLDALVDGRALVKPEDA